MSFLTSTEKYHHESIIPAGLTIEQIDTFQKNHDVLLTFDPDYRSHEEVKSKATDKSKTYKVTDTNTAPVGGETIELEITITETADSQEWSIQAPFGLTQTSVWTIKEGGDTKPGEGTGRLWLVEDTTVKGNRLVVGKIQTKHVESWQGIHERWIAALQKSATA
ncbi:hypothetical protein EJ05DRAFT_475742 [Pseudovirgaria hyperparasitica]|uniref:DUF7053 domain-containing protein n=1 Tax=Pseudovirgaria hyperparasitica TaxID=470096 RepID=A0A6A6WA16_9PEZI|nr:uncharacterized protein EJ05DRAFT_475742 [Pseudovirgaria hyperparasitica]KAF2758427.1 hypothetical protein EJ05DRAFT_475742 [Pseudovirgaria hyperparasitica]